jgi:hypothetical protein
MPSVQSRHVTNATPLDLFWLKVAHLSNTEHRFLPPTYSPSSRVPCADLTPFIIDRLRSHDVASIRQLMRAVIAGNPGLASVQYSACKATSGSTRAARRAGTHAATPATATRSARAVTRLDQSSGVAADPVVDLNAIRCRDRALAERCAVRKARGIRSGPGVLSDGADRDCVVLSVVCRDERIGANRALGVDGDDGLLDCRRRRVQVECGDRRCWVGRTRHL